MKRCVLLAVAGLVVLASVSAWAGSVTSKWDLELYGYLKLEAAYDTQKTTDGDIMLWVNPQSPAGKDDEFNMSVWESRFGFNIKGPDVQGYKATGKFEGDFYGRVNAAGNDGKPPPHKPLLRLRLAYADLTSESTNWSLRIGQDWDAFITVIPKSVNFTFFGEQGSPGYRRPQIWAKRVVDLGVCKMTAKAGIARTLGEMTAGFDVDKNKSDDGVDSGTPTYEGNLIFEMPFMGAKQPLKVSVSGEYGKETADNSSSNTFVGIDYNDFESWLAMGSLFVPITDKFALQGAYWQGANLDAYEAGILQGINLTLGKSIGAKGGWCQALFMPKGPTGKLTLIGGYGVDDPKDEDLNTGGRAKNEYPMGSVWYKLNDAVTFAFEYSHIKTSYKDQDPATDDRFHGAMYYYF